VIGGALTSSLPVQAQSAAAQSKFCKSLRVTTTPLGRGDPLECEKLKALIGLDSLPEA
jgi:hypothetical protein